MPVKSSKRVKPKNIVVLSFKKGDMVQLGNGSFSNLLLTKSTVGRNGSMMGYSVFKPGIDTRQKIHVDAEELAYVVAGSGKITIGQEKYAFKKNDSLYIPQGIPHGVRNDGKEDVVMVFFFSTPSYPKTVDG